MGAYVQGEHACDFEKDMNEELDRQLALHAEEDWRRHVKEEGESSEEGSVDMSASKSDSMHTPSDVPRAMKASNKKKVDNDTLYWPGDFDAEKVERNKNYWQQYSQTQTPPVKRQRFEDDVLGKRGMNSRPKPSAKTFKPKPTARKPAYKAMPRPRPYVSVSTSAKPEVSPGAKPEFKAMPRPKHEIVEIDS